MRVVKLALDWQDRISFILNEDLTLKRIKFGEFLNETFRKPTGNRSGKFDASFALMSLEFAELIERLLSLFGGEDRSKIVEEHKPLDSNTLHVTDGNRASDVQFFSATHPQVCSAAA